MLNIPEDVKTLFKRDDVFKNFHVHFPNGETTDLNNDNVVSESVTFTESLCSQQSFRFGLTEASEIQFTAVGIPNVRGATIECAIEICVDDLGAEWLTDNAPTGNEEFLDPQVCTYGSRNMYRVPYGRFIVDTCPRNHESMWKREVTAYTERMDDAETINPGQVAFMASFFPTVPTYTARLKPLAYACLYNSNPDALTSLGYSKTTIGRSDGDSSYSIETALTLTKSDGTSEVFRFMVSHYAHRVPPVGGDIPTNLYGFTWTSNNSADYDIISKVGKGLVDTFDIDYAQSGYETMAELVKAGTSGVTGHYMDLQFVVNAGTSGLFVTSRFNVPYGTGVVYPYMEGVSTGLAFHEVTSVTVFDNDLHESFSVRNGGVSFAQYADNDSAGTLAQYKLSFNSTLQTERKYGNKTYKWYSFANAFSLSGIAQGYLELQCRFGSPSRTGGMEITALDNTTSTVVLPSDYASLWYDETTISPIGYVALKFKDETGEEQDLTVQIGTGASVYDLSDNEVLKNMAFTVSKSEAEAGTTIESKLLAFLNAVFTPNIPDLSFVPIELEKKGLPYFEAGDAVTITTGDGQTVPSFILRQTIKGIQFLQADVESANGEAVELIES